MSDSLEKIQDEVTNLSSSPLYTFRISNNYVPVVGEGNPSAEVMFVGEAPGRNEAEQGKPFCGAAGKLLSSLLEGIGLQREEVYITSIVKDRPPKNRDPLPEEIEAYGPFLDRQIEIIKPNIIVALGRYSMIYVMKKFGLEEEIEPIGKAHGKAYTAQASYGTITIIAEYHPAATIYNQSLKTVLAEDFKTIKAHL